MRISWSTCCFKGTATRSAEDIAQAIDSIGGQLDAFTAKEYASYYIKVLDEHLPLAIDILSDVVRHPAFRESDIEREKKVIVEEIKMVEDTPDDLVHEVFTQSFWEGHPLARPILGGKESVEALTEAQLREYFAGAYTADNFIISAVGNIEHAQVRELVERAFDGLPVAGRAVIEETPVVVPQAIVRAKDIEQCHLCLGVGGYPQNHDDRYVSYVLNTLLGGSMSSRLFQNVREKRGLAYAVFSGLSAYRDAGAFTVYAGCATETLGEVIDLIVKELRRIKREPVPEAELRRVQGSPEGQPDAEPGEHGQPHVAPGAPGDLLRPAVRSRRDARGDRTGVDRGSGAGGAASVLRLWPGGDGAGPAGRFCADAGTACAGVTVAGARC